MSPDQTSSGTRIGYLAVAASAVLFSAKAVGIKLAYAHGAEPLVFQTLRMAYSAPLFLGMALLPRIRGRARESPLSGRDLAVIAALGLLGYYLASIFDLMGLQYVSAGMERLILYAYPTLVVLFNLWIFRMPAGPGLLLPMLLCYAGIALAFGGEAAVADPGSRIAWGAFLVFLSAVCYALFLVIQGRIMGRVGPHRITGYAMLASGAAVGLHFLAAHPLDSLAQPAPVQGLAFAVAIFSTVVPAYLLGYGLHRIGATRAAVVSNVGPVSTLAMAAWFLGEPAGPFQWIGLALVLAGSFLLASGKEKQPGGARPEAETAAGKAGIGEETGADGGSPGGRDEKPGGRQTENAAKARA
jgi:drug/metabolite transporter (DMT)-like permease